MAYRAPPSFLCTDPPPPPEGPAKGGGGAQGWIWIWGADLRAHRPPGEGLDGFPDNSAFGPALRERAEGGEGAVQRKAWCPPPPGSDCSVLSVGGGVTGLCLASSALPPPPPVCYKPLSGKLSCRHTPPAPTSQYWSRQTPARTRRVPLDAPGQRHGQQPVSGTANPRSSQTGQVIRGLR